MFNYKLINLDILFCILDNDSYSLLDQVPTLSELTQNIRLPRLLFHELAVALAIPNEEWLEINGSGASKLENIFKLWLSRNNEHATRRQLVDALICIKQNRMAKLYRESILKKGMLNSVIIII